MKIYNVTYGHIKTSRGDIVDFSYKRPIWKNIALYGAIIALVGVYLYNNIWGF